MKKQIYSTIAFFLITGLFFISDRVSQALAGETVIYAYDFTGGWGSWYADNGVWEVGVPGYPGPENAYSGNNVAGTVLKGNYPDYTRSRLISPSIQLPSAGVNEEIHLRFWQWTGIHHHDNGLVQISWEESGEWTPWETVSISINRNSPLWSYSGVDLTSYAGKKVRIGFFLFQKTSPYSGVGPGWYIDDVEIWFGGSLKVNILPQEAIDAGAKWRVAGGAWKNSGDTILSLAKGVHTVEFRNVAGWIRPAKRPVNIEYQKITTITETYLFNPSVGLPGMIMLLLDD